MVYVVSKSGRPLMPTEHCGKVKHLLKDGKAKVLHREPFTIQLLYETTEYVQATTLGVDTGSGTFGAAVVTDDSHKVLYMSEVEVRNDIATKMKKRSRYRRDRRNRRTRYRKARFDNRKNSIKKDRFSPTMQSKINAHEREINFIKSILPVTHLVIETGTFDMALMKNPALANPKIARWGYQKGPNYGYANTKAMVKARDGYKCAICKGKVDGRNHDISAKTANFIIDAAVLYNANAIVFEHLDKKGKVNGSKKQKIKLWRSQEVQAIVENKAHRLGMRISRVNAYNTSRLAYDGSGLVKRSKDNYSVCTFQTGKVYNCDLSASYNIGARYFVREILKSLPARVRLCIEAKVPQCCKRSTCTFSTLISLNAELLSA